MAPENSTASPVSQDEFYIYAKKGEYALALAMTLAVLYAMIVVWIGNEVGLGASLFGLGIYAGAYIAVRDGYTGPKM